MFEFNEGEKKEKVKKVAYTKKNLTRYKIAPSRNQDIIYINLLLKTQKK